MKLVVPYNNFSRGRIDHNMMGRFDLPFYTSGADVFDNFISNFKGNAKYRTGFEAVYKYEDSALYEFKFNVTQNYVLVFTNTKLRFLSYDVNGNLGWVLDGSSNILEVTTPYNLAQSKELSVAQNFDVMYICHPAHAPRKLTRVSANSFTIGTFTRTGDPFTNPNWPAIVTFYKNRLWYARTPNQITTLWGSEVGSFDLFTVPSPLTDASPIVLTMADIAQKIEWLFPSENSLVIGAADGIIALNGGNVNTPITANSVEANLSSADGTAAVEPLAKDGLIFYVRNDARRLLTFSYELLTESFQAKDITLLGYDVTRGDVKKIRYKKDEDDLIYCLKNNGEICSLNFNREENIAGWHENKTQGEFKDIAVITNEAGRETLFALVKRGSDFFIETLAPYVEFKYRDDFFTDNEAADTEAYTRFAAEQLKDCVYLDSALRFDLLQTSTITYDPTAGTITAGVSIFVSGNVGREITYKTKTGYESGRFKITAFTSGTVVSVVVLQAPTTNVYDLWYLSFVTVTGLGDFNGKTVGIVTDGGFFDFEEISGGTLTLPQNVNSIVIGYQYSGVIKSFVLGLQIQTENTQTTMKALNRIGLRTVMSAGGKFGTSRYRLEPVQRLRQGALNYLPPPPMDGTTYVAITDDMSTEKVFYVVQDEPLPLNIASVMVDADYAVMR